MKNLNVSQKNYKFPIGGVLAILVALVVGFDIIFDTVSCLDFFKDYLERLPLHFLPNDFIQIVYNIISMLWDSLLNITLLFTILAFGILLIFKQRKRILILFPTFGIFTIIATIIFWIVELIIESIILNAYISASVITTLFIQIFAYTIIVLAYVILAIIIVSNCGSSKKSLSFLAWIAPLLVAFSYIVLTTLSIATYVPILTNYIKEYQSIIQYAPNFKEIFWDSVVSFSYNIIYYITFGTLLTLTFFFSARWIVNPYKKAKSIASSTESLE